VTGNRNLAAASSSSLCVVKSSQGVISAVTDKKQEIGSIPKKLLTTGEAAWRRRTTPVINKICS
jgi:hypothetical protein